MSTIYLLDALCILVLGMTALFAFGLSGSRRNPVFKAIFFVSLALALFTLWFGHWLTPPISPMLSGRRLVGGSPRGTL